MGPSSGCLSRAAVSPVRDLSTPLHCRDSRSHRALVKRETFAARRGLKKQEGSSSHMHVGTEGGDRVRLSQTTGSDECGACVVVARRRENNESTQARAAEP